MPIDTDSVSKRQRGGRMSSILEKPALSVDDVAELMGLSRRSIIRLFEKERGVLILGRPETMHKRRYRSLRIPRAVYERVIGRLSVK
jgi:transcriptional regulator GlxA family with amidase domain